MKIKLKNFNEKLAKTNRDKEDIEIQYEEILEKINDLKDKYEDQMQFIFSNISKPNEQLKELISVHTKEIESNQAEVDAIAVN